MGGRAAIVTGASRGIGRAIVERFLNERVSVLTCGRGARPVHLASEVVWVQADMSRTADAERIVAAARERFGEA